MLKVGDRFEIKKPKGFKVTEVRKGLYVNTIVFEIDYGHGVSDEIEIPEKWCKKIVKKEDKKVWLSLNVYWL